jgi:hypothetical protein
MVNIELKKQPDMTTELADAVVKLVEFMRLDHHVLISSFDHDQLVKVRELTKTIATGILTDDRIDNLNEYLQLLDADAYHPNCYSESDSMGTRELNLYGITTIRESGRYVNVWTCNNKDDMRQLIAAGVTGLISDFPNRVRDVLLDRGESLFLSKDFPCSQRGNPQKYRDKFKLLRKPQPSWSLDRHPTRGWLTCSPMTRHDFVKPAFALRSRFVKTHALSLLGTTRLLSRSVGVIKINKLTIFTGKTWTLFLQKLENFPRCLTKSRN